MIIEFLTPRSTLQPKCFLRIFFIALSLILSGCGGGSGDGSDPITINVPIAYIDRALYVTNDDGEQEPVYSNIESPRVFNGGARLMIRLKNQSVDVTSAEFGPDAYDIKDLSPSADGKKLVFAARRTQLPMFDEDDQPTWELWEYNIEESSLDKIVQPVAEVPKTHDINPIYLPDGRIVFSSTRQTDSRLILQDESKANKAVFSGLTDSRSEITNDDAANEEIGEAFNLHIIDPETQDIKQLTFNQSHDLQPTLLADGRIAYLRWDRSSDGDIDKQSIYTVNPDGSDVSLLYGYDSQTSIAGDIPTTFFDLTTTRDGQLLAVLKRRDNTGELNEATTTSRAPFLGGNLVKINYQQFISANQTINGSNSTGTGEAFIYNSGVDLSNNISEVGYVNSAYSYNDGSDKILLTRTACRLTTPGSSDIKRCGGKTDRDRDSIEADPFYSLWAFDTQAGTISYRGISPVEGRMISDAVVLNETEVPQNKPSNNSNEQYGALYIESIYDFDGILNTPDGASLAELADPSNTAFLNRSARFIRIVKAVSLPDDEIKDYDEDAFGVSNGDRGMREILGYAPIEPDGSTLIKIPSQVAFQMDIVDVNGQRLFANNDANRLIFPIHKNWLSLAPGEVRRCVGCHDNNTTAPHGRSDAGTLSANIGAASTDRFPNTGVATEQGWTMAEAYASIGTTNGRELSDSQLFDGARELSPHLLYNDEWSIVEDTDQAIDNRYAVISIGPGGSEAIISNIGAELANIPTSERCIREWDHTCRIVINYENHIQALWEKPRNGDNDYSCINCHANNGDIYSDAEQLLLTRTNIDDDFYLDSHQELLRNDPRVAPLEQQTDNAGELLYLTEIVTNDNGTPLDTTDDFDESVRILDNDGNDIPLVRKAGDNPINPLDYVKENGVIQLVTLDNGDDALDDDGNTIPLTTEFTDNSNAVRMEDSRANRNIGDNQQITSQDFFVVMTNENNIYNDTFNHTKLNQDDAMDQTPLMTQEELRLISEWLDIGAQYYNNPFDLSDD